VLAQRMTAKRGVTEDALQIRVALEADPEQVVRLALEPVGGLPYAGQRRNRWITFRHRHLQAHAMAVADGVEVVHGLEPVLAFGVIDPADVYEQLEVERRVGLEVARQV